ncbi:transcriptional regulator domain-containing protein [Bradyrhizobium arachidis]|uniref:transcriptional regulator domain-containing protein n=1 Tax=Bradyrhizobium arachidis TaxID=858423 RepID=UPI0038D0B46A
MVRCRVPTGDLRKHTAPQKGISCDVAWEWLRRDPDYQEDYRACLAANDPAQPRATCDGSGGSRFPADPRKTFDKQAVFWAPEVLSTVLPVRAAKCVGPKGYQLDFGNLPGSDLRRAPDGWHVPLGGAKHRFWLRSIAFG